MLMEYKINNEAVFELLFHINSKLIILSAVSAAEAVIHPQCWSGSHSGSGTQGRNLEFVHGAGNR